MMQLEEKRECKGAHKEPCQILPVQCKCQYETC